MKVDLAVENGVRGPNITFKGANIHIISGSGATNDNGNSTGLGNLIIGYNEVPKTLNAGDRGVSHNLVMGEGNKFTAWAYSGILNGFTNLINGPLGVILSGDNNQVTGNAINLITGGVIITGSGNSLFRWHRVRHSRWSG